MDRHEPLICVYFIHTYKERVKRQGGDMASFVTIHALDAYSAMPRITSPPVDRKCIPFSDLKYKVYLRLVVNCEFREVPKIIVGL
jgi:hypothetical protein